MSDSLYVAFANSAFPDLSLDGQSLRTTKFVVKTAEEYGRPNLALTLTLPTASTSEPIAFAVGMRDATAAAPKTFYLDLGDGNLKPYTATTHGTPATQNVSGVTPQGVVKVYVPDGEDVTAFAMHGVALAAADFGPSAGTAACTASNSRATTSARSTFAVPTTPSRRRSSPTSTSAATSSPKSHSTTTTPFTTSTSATTSSPSSPSRTATCSRR